MSSLTKSEQPSFTPPLTDIGLGLQTVPEIPNFVQLNLTGRLPLYLGKSTLYRQGPGKYEVTHSDGKKRNVLHWFDGHALLHQFSINASENKVTYRNKFIAKGLTSTMESMPYDKYNDFTFGPADPCKSILGKFFQLWTPKVVDPKTGLPPFPNVNVTVQKIPGKDYVLRTDANINLTLNEDELEAKEFFSFRRIDPALKGIMTAAHGHYDKDTDEFINYVYDFSAGHVEYRVFSITSDGSAKMLATFKDIPVYIHSFATTQKYVVLCLWPTDLNGLQILFNKSIMGGLHFKKDRPSKFVVISREEQKVVATYESNPFFCFHTINAYDMDDGICIDLCRYDDTEIIDKFLLENLRYNDELPKLNVARYKLENLSTAIQHGPSKKYQVKEEILSESSFELPRIHPDYMRKDYRYTYGINSTNVAFGEITKIDVKSGKEWSWKINRGIVGEPIFVPNPNGEKEDDGCLLVVVLDANRLKSSMFVLDAVEMKELARAEVQQVVPLGFHGAFKSN